MNGTFDSDPRPCLSPAHLAPGIYWIRIKLKLNSGEKEHFQKLVVIPD